jgi:hypothetical protein
MDPNHLIGINSGINLRINGARETANVNTTTKNIPLFGLPFSKGGHGNSGKHKKNTKKKRYKTIDQARFGRIHFDSPFYENFKIQTKKF